MPQLFTNNATSTLAADITNVATSLTVATGHGSRFPSISNSSDYFLVTLEKSDGTREIVRVTARSGDVFTVTRAQEGTTAAAFSTGDTVELRLTAATLSEAIVAPAQIYAGAMREIQSVTTSGSQSSVVFSGIQGTYRDLLVVVSARSNNASNFDRVLVQFNGDTGANYESAWQGFALSGAFTGGGAARTSAYIGAIGASTSTANLGGVAQARIGRYAGSSFKAIAGLSTGGGAANTYGDNFHGFWRSTSAVTSMTVLLENSTFVDGSTITLYGIGGEVGGAALAPIYTKYDPFCPPAAPSSLDNEFTVDSSLVSGAPTGFTSVGTLTPTHEVRLGKLRMVAPAGTGFNSSLVEKNLPSGDFTVATHVSHAVSTSTNVVGLYVRNSTTNQRINIGIYNNSGAYGDKFIAAERFNGFASRTALATSGFYDHNVFFRIRLSGSTLFVETSTDGVFWVTNISEAVSSQFGTDLPNRVGLNCAPYSGLECVGVFDFFRYFPTGNADIGRNIGVGSDGALLDPTALYLHNKVI